MASRIPRENLYGFTSPLYAAFQPPIVANRAPTTSDFAALGAVWIYPGIANAWILVAIVNNAANWSNIEGGAGEFSSLTVDPGPVDLVHDGSDTISIGTGTWSGTMSIGNSDASAIDISGSAISFDAGSALSMDGSAASAINVGASLVSGAITIGGTAETGNITLGSSSAAQTVTIANGSGASVVDIANSQVAGSVSIGAGMVAGTISIGGAAQTGTITLGDSTAGQIINIGNAAGANTINVGHATTGNITNLESPITALPGPVYVYTGAGAPSAGLALHVGDIYINTTAASATTRMYIATAASTWTNVTCAA